MNKKVIILIFFLSTSGISFFSWRIIRLDQNNNIHQLKNEDIENKIISAEEKEDDFQDAFKKNNSKGKKFLSLLSLLSKEFLFKMICLCGFIFIMFVIFLAIVLIVEIIKKRPFTSPNKNLPKVEIEIDKGYFKISNTVYNHEPKVHLFYTCNKSANQTYESDFFLYQDDINKIQNLYEDLEKKGKLINENDENISEDEKTVIWLQCLLNYIGRNPHPFEEIFLYISQKLEKFSGEFLLLLSEFLNKEKAKKQDNEFPLLKNLIANYQEERNYYCQPNEFKTTKEVYFGLKPLPKPTGEQSLNLKDFFEDEDVGKTIEKYENFLYQHLVTGKHFLWQGNLLFANLVKLCNYWINLTAEISSLYGVYSNENWKRQNNDYADLAKNISTEALQKLNKIIRKNTLNNE